MVIEAANGSPAEELADGIDAQVLEVHAYAAGQDCVAVADRDAGRWGNRLAALLVNAVPPYRTDAWAVYIAESAADVDAMVHNVAALDRFSQVPKSCGMRSWFSRFWVESSVLLCRA